MNTQKDKEVLTGRTDESSLSESVKTPLVDALRKYFDKEVQCLNIDVGKGYPDPI